MWRGSFQHGVRELPGLAQPLAGQEPLASSGGSWEAGLCISLQISVVQKGEVGLDSRSATLQRALISEFPIAQKQTGRRASRPYYQQKQMAAFPRWLHSLRVSEDFWPVPA